MAKLRTRRRPGARQADSGQSDAGVRKAPVGAAHPILNVQRTAGNRAAGTLVQRRGEDTPGSWAQSAESGAREAAAGVSSETHPVSESPAVASLGILEHRSFPLDYAEKGQARFEREMRRVETGRIPGVYGDKTDTRAYQTLKAKQAAYIEDQRVLPKGDEAYNLFVPLANAATRAIIRTNEVGLALGFTPGADLAEELTDEESAALQEAAGSLQMEGVNVETASMDLEGVRMRLRGASATFAAALREDVIQALQANLAEEQENVAEIRRAINKATEVANYVETAVSLVAGGGAAKLGKVASMSGTEAAVEASSYLGEAVAFGAEAYYQDELSELQAKINTLTSAIDATRNSQAKSEFEGAQRTYIGTVREYEAAKRHLVDQIMARRELFSQMGMNADRIMDPSGGEQNVSQTLAYANAVMEMTALLRAAMAAGDEADSDLSAAYVHIGSHRGPYASMDYHTLETVWGNPSIDARVGPDHELLKRTKWMTENWLAGADIVLQQASTTLGTGEGAEGGISALMGQVGLRQY